MNNQQIIKRLRSISSSVEGDRFTQENIAQLINDLQTEAPNHASLKEYLEANEVSVYKLSKETGIAYSTLSDYVNKGSEMSFGNAVKISIALEISFDYLNQLI